MGENQPHPTTIKECRHEEVLLINVTNALLSLAMASSELNPRHTITLLPVGKLMHAIRGNEVVNTTEGGTE